MADPTNDLVVAMKDLAAAMSTGISKTDDLHSAQDKWRNAQKELNAAIKAGKKDLEDYHKAVKQAVDDIRSVYEENKKLDKEMERISQRYQSSKKGIMDYAKGIHGTANSIKGISGALTKYTTILGASTLSMQNIVRATVDYHNSIFQLSRTQQVAGKGTSDFGSAIANIRKNTVLSTNQFLGMADSFSRLYVGIKPTATEMANMAQMLQSQFGPNVDVIKQKLGELGEIQSQFPAMYEEIERGMKLVAKAKGGDKGAQRELDQLKERMYLTAQNMNMSQAQKDNILKSLTVTTKAQDDENELQKTLAENTKKSENAILAMGQATEGAMIAAAKASQELYGWIEKSAWAAGVAAIAFAGLDVAMGLASGIIATKGAIKGLEMMSKHTREVQRGMGLLRGDLLVNIKSLGTMGRLTSVIGVGAGIAGAFFAGWEAGKFLDDLFGISNKIGEIIGKSKDKSFMADTGDKRVKDLADKYGDAFMKKFRELGGEQAKGTAKHDIAVKALKTMREETEKMLVPTKELRPEIEKMYVAYDRVLTDQNAMLSMLNRITEAMKGQVGLAESFGQANESALLGVIKAAESAFMVTQKASKDAAKAAQLSIEDLKIPNVKIYIDPELSGAEQLDSVQKQIQKVLETSTISENDRYTISQRLLQVSEQLNKSKQASAAITNAQLAKDEVELRIQEQYSSAYESRLNAERKLMESAQFGLGASVDMMQKQVDLAYEFMKVQSATDQKVAQRVQKEHDLTDEQMERIKNTKTQAEAQEYIVSIKGKDAKATQDLLQYAYKHQQYTTKIMEQQQKIYDLTKDIREGYLDAVREMSIGAGEFSKIIGTQDMGVTQLMDVVKDVTGEFKTNSMKLGGKQTQQQTAGGLGTEITGQYTKQGIKFIGGQQQEERGQRLPGWWEAKQKAEAVMRGDVPSGAQSKVGEAVVPGVENYLGPERERKITPPTVLDMVKGITDYTGAVNAPTRKGYSPGMEDVSKIQAYKTAIGMGTEYLGKTTPPQPASGGFVTTPGGNRLPLPKELTDINKTLSSVNKNTDPQKANTRVQTTPHEKKIDKHLDVISKYAKDTVKEVSGSTKVLSKDLKSVSTNIVNSTKSTIVSNIKQIDRSRVGNKTLEDVRNNMKEMMGGGNVKRMDGSGGKTKSLREMHEAAFEKEKQARKQATDEYDKQRQSAETKGRSEQMQEKDRADIRKLENDFLKRQAAMKAKGVESRGIMSDEDFIKEMNEQKKMKGEIDAKKAAYATKWSGGTQSIGYTFAAAQVKQEAESRRGAQESAVPAVAAFKAQQAAAGKAAAQQSPKPSDKQGVTSSDTSAGEENVVVVVKLSPELMAEVLKSRDARVQIEQATRTT